MQIHPKKSAFWLICFRVFCKQKTTFRYVSKTMKNDRVCFVQGFPLFPGCEARVEDSLRPPKRPQGLWGAVEGPKVA